LDKLTGYNLLSPESITRANCPFGEIRTLAKSLPTAKAAPKVGAIGFDKLIGERVPSKFETKAKELFGEIDTPWGLFPAEQRDPSVGTIGLDKLTGYIQLFPYIVIRPNFPSEEMSTP
jgi:hypothetical protein